MKSNTTTEIGYKKPGVYLANPFGFSEAGRFFLQKKITPVLKKIGYEVINPFEKAPLELFEKALKLPLGKIRDRRFQEANKITGERNVEAIRCSRIVLALLDGQEVDSGTASEIGYAYSLGKIIIAYRSDFRQTGEEGAKVNLQVEFFINDSGGMIVHEFSKLKEKMHQHFRRIAEEE